MPPSWDMSDATSSGSPPPTKRRRTADGKPFASATEVTRPSPPSNQPRVLSADSLPVAVSAWSGGTAEPDSAPVGGDFDLRLAQFVERVSEEEASESEACEGHSAAENFAELRLPIAALQHVFRSLSNRDLCNCLLVNRRWSTKVWRCVPGLVLTFGNRTGIDDQFLGLLSRRAPQLERLNIAYCNSVSDEGLKTLATFVNLRELDISNACGISGQEPLAVCLRQLGGLRSLSLSNGLRLSFTDEEMKCMLHLPHLEELSLDACNMITDRGLQHLRACPKLKRLSLAELNKITALGIRLLSPLTHLSSLNLAHCFGVHDDVADCLLGFPNLTEVNLCCVRLGQGALARLMAKFPELDAGLALA